MKKLIALIATPVLAFSMNSVFAGDKGSNPVSELIQEHMLATGYITEADIEARQTEREEVKAMIEALVEAGDEEGVAALKEELKAAREEKKEAVAAYVEANLDLSEAIDAAIEEVKAERASAREDRKARRGM